MKGNMFVLRYFLDSIVRTIPVLIILVFTYYTWTYTYWKRKKIPCICHLIDSRLLNLGKIENIHCLLRRCHLEMKSKGLKHGGFCLKFLPAYFVVDLEYMKDILVKNFNHFVDRPFYSNEKTDPLTCSLFTIGGDKWRFMRTKMSPGFTTGKMKSMLDTLLENVENLLEKIEDDCVNNLPVDMKTTCLNYTTDVAGSTIFGLNCSSFKDEKSPFRNIAPKVVTGSPLHALKTAFVMCFPKLGEVLKMTFLPPDLSNFFSNIVKDSINYRKSNNIVRNDILQMLMEMLESESDPPVTFNDVAAQSLGLLIGGAESSSTTLTFSLYELSRRPDLQEKVRSEINTVLEKHDGKITYTALQEMKYLDQVVSETLRMYPPLPFLMRECVKDYKLPEQNTTIDKGTCVIISILGLHYDSEVYPNPDQFDPDRFSEENKKKRHRFAYIPFGEGPRICIGMRFGLLQIKVGLVALLQNYKFSVNRMTKEPVEMKIVSLTYNSKDDIWLNAEKV